MDSKRNLLYLLAKCPGCSQIVPYDRSLEMCACMYCGTQITPLHWVMDPQNDTINVAVGEDFAENKVVGVVENECLLPHRGIVVTTKLKNEVALDNPVFFTSKRGSCLGTGIIVGIEYRQKLLDMAEEGMEVGLLVSSKTTGNFVGSVIVSK